jgi:hypothetical protein
MNSAPVLMKSHFICHSKLNVGINTLRRHRGRAKVWLHSFLTSAMNFTARPLYPRIKKPHSRLSKPESWSGHFWEEKNLLLLQIATLHNPNLQPLTMPTAVWYAQSVTKNRLGRSCWQHLFALLSVTCLFGFVHFKSRKPFKMVRKKAVSRKTSLPKRL